MKARWMTVLLVALLCAGCAAPATDRVPPLIETGVDADAWATVPAGPFLLGQHEHETALDYDYEIMVTDVTNAQYAAYLNAALVEGAITVTESQVQGAYPGDVFRGAHHELEIPERDDWIYLALDDPAARILFDGATFAVKEGYGNHPATFVSWFGAWGYCIAHDWRLPSNAEWEKAARGTDNRPFPWGHDITNNSANFLSSNDLFERLFEGAGGTTPVGFYNGGTYEGYATRDAASPYGLYDMAGNVWQWTGDVQEGAHYRTLRGGAYNNYAYNLRIWTHNNADPIHVSPGVGFRCARGGQ